MGPSAPVRRRRAVRPDLDDGVMTILEPGLWSALPERCWQLEVDFIAKQESDSRLRAPDEARAAFEEANAARGNERERLLEGGAPRRLFDGEADA